MHRSARRPGSTWPLLLALTSLAACAPARTTSPRPIDPVGPIATAGPVGPDAANATATGPTAPASAPAATAPRYHAQNESFGTLRGFTVPPVSRRPPHRLFHVACTYDEDARSPRHRCRTVTPKAARAAYPDGEMSRVLRWLRGSIGIVEGTAPPRLARAVEKYQSSGASLGVGADTIVAITVTTSRLYDEAITGGCEHAGGHPCDPISRPTGRRLRAYDVEGPSYVHADRVLDVELSLDGVVALANGAVVYQPVEIARIVGEPGDPTTYADLFARLTNAGTAPATLADLAAAPPPADPAVRQILAYDRAVVAARLGDHAACVAAVADLDAALTAAPAPEPSLAPLLAAALPFLHRVAAGELVFTAPAGLDAYVRPVW